MADIKKVINFQVSETLDRRFRDAIRSRATKTGETMSMAAVLRSFIVEFVEAENPTKPQRTVDDDILDDIQKLRMSL